LIDLDEVSENLPGWIRQHLTDYITTGGEKGHIWRGVPTLLLRTIGWKSGRPSLLPLIYGRHGDDYLLVASKGGHPQHPAWYVNLCHHADVHVQVGADKFAAGAHTAEDSERPALWAIMRAIWPQYDDYQAATERRIPVVVLTRKER